jgi:RNAse (barnase) inhibitor barstar
MSISLDAINWKNKNDFYNSYCNATKAPNWFGMNLDAFLDSLRGGICEITPKKIIIRNLTKKIKEYFDDDFWIDIEDICKEENVELQIQNN